jgi:Spy/CpxP family protein refolding chaperone
MKSLPFLALISLLMAALPAAPLLAQPEDSPRPALEKLDQVRRIKLIEFLDLKEEQAIRYFTREKDFRAAEKDLFAKRRGLIEQMNGLAKAEAGEADIQKKMAEIYDVDQKILSARWDFTRKCGDILTPQQVGKLVVFEQHFQEEVRKALREFPRQRRMGREP